MTLINKLVLAFFIGGLSLSFGQVSNQEIVKFANVYKAKQIEDSRFQKLMVLAIESNGLDIETYQAIHATKNDENYKADFTGKDLENFAKAEQQAKELQEEFKLTMFKVLQKEGLTMERYTEIASAIKKDYLLEQRLRKLLVY